MALRELRKEIAVSLYLSPCTEFNLQERDFLKSCSLYVIGTMLQVLDSDGATYYRGDVIHIKKSWARKNLKGYDLDFRTTKQKIWDSTTPFARSVVKARGGL